MEGPGLWLMKEANLWPPKVVFIWKVQTLGQLDSGDTKPFDSDPLTGWRSRGLTSQARVFITL